MAGEVAPYGAWPSPITAASLIAGVSTPTEIVVDGHDIWWAEVRPDENGRTALVRWHDGEAVDAVGPGANVRTLVHEYGGGAWWVAGGVLVYSELSDQRLWRLAPSDPSPVALTPEPPAPRSVRYADGRPTPDGRWYVCVRERHHTAGAEPVNEPAGAHEPVNEPAGSHEPVNEPAGSHEPVNEIVALALDGSLRIEVLVAGPDFVSAPRPSPDGRRLVWVQWTHPNMPWDDTELWVADLDTTGAAPVVTAPRCVAGVAGGESVVQPAWTPDGRLHAVSDRTGWWGVYDIAILGDGEPTPVRVVSGEEMAQGDWNFGQVRHAVTASGAQVCAPVAHPVDRLELGGRAVVIPNASTVDSPRAMGDDVVVLVGSHRHGPSVVRVDPSGAVDVVRPPHAHHLDPAFLPDPEAVTFPTTGGVTAHARFYRPASPTHTGPPGAAPPLIVLAHGGPTAAASNELNLGLRYWTSRGFAVVDVDYRGSTGYGRPYRQALYREWGVADVEDCVAAVTYLAARGDIDPARVGIRGGSAGGYTVLRALSAADVFAAGVSRYGIADLEALVADTHKFESRYADQLVGPYPERRDLYVERSPIHHVERLRVPMLVLQGLDDTVVPPNQAEMIVAAIEANGVPVSSVVFAGEGHGFRKAENIVAALEAELAFFGEVFGFTPADPVPPVAWRGDPPSPT